MNTLSKAVASYNMDDANRRLARLRTFEYAIEQMGVHALIALYDSAQLCGDADSIALGEIHQRYTDTRESGGTTLPFGGWRQLLTCQHAVSA